MNSTASAALTSAENTAASPSAPTSGGSVRTRIIGSAASADPERRELRARDDAEQRRHDREEQQAERVQADAEPDGAIVARAEDLLQQPGRDDERRRDHGEREDCPASSAARTASTPASGCTTRQRLPSTRRPASASGSARAKPASFTASCTTLTHADGEQAAGREVDRDHHAADRAADPGSGTPATTLEDRAHRRSAAPRG